MKITYNITEDDLKQYVSSDFTTEKKTLPKVLIIIGSIVLIVIAALALIAKEYAIAIPIIIFLGIAYSILKLPKYLQKRYAKSITLNEERTVKLSNEYLTVTNHNRVTSYKYSEIKEVKPDNQYFIYIIFNKGDSLLIPKTAFENTSCMHDFINNLKTKLL